MIVNKNGGNPLKDREESLRRFNVIVKPTLQNVGFKTMGNGQNMYNSQTNQVVIISSAPSNLKIITSTKQLIRKYRKELENPSISYLFTRDKKTYPNTSTREVYERNLTKISGMNLLDGVAVGLEFLPNFVSSLNNKSTNFRFIS
jgi:hypothetical protein